jgi:2-iminobutanoate/2-iminopropanoate deaminase
MSSKKQINTPKAYMAFGPFSQAIKTDTLVFVSGQLPIHPSTGKIVAGGIKEETRQVLRNLREILKAAGSSLNDIVKATVYITDMNYFSKMNEVYEKFFSNQVPPARSCVEVARLAKGAKVEIEAIALVRKP